MFTYSYKGNIQTTPIRPHAGREKGEIGVNHVRKDTAYEDEVHTDSVVEPFIDKTVRTKVDTNSRISENK